MSTTTLDVVNPYDLTVLDRIKLENWDAIDKYLADAERLFNSREKWLPTHKRIQILNNIADKMQHRSDELASLIAAEGGKPLIDSRVEVERAIAGIQLCVSQLNSDRGVEIPMDLTAAGAGRCAYVKKEPIGVVVAISAFNHPLNLIVHQVAPAIAVGCPVLVKPALDTPLSCKVFVEIARESGLPDMWCQLVLCDQLVAEKMVTDKRVSFLSFIGSAKVGWMLKSKLAPGTRCALEHGGVAPVIVDDNVDIDTVVPSILKGGFYHSGQVCVSVQRVYVPINTAREFALRLAKEAVQLIVGNATEEETQCGPLIRPTEVERVEKWVNEAVEEGAELITGGKKLSLTTYAPTVLLNPSKHSKVSEQEVFGPVVCIYSYDNLDEAISLANALPFAFQAAVYTENMVTAQHCIDNLDASAVMVNDHTAFRVDWMPFAGRKLSGYGTGGIGYTMEDMTQTKMAVYKRQ
ncbi:aldehyde dehydrogenase family protein [Thalassotalea euphylliae]|uniref:aldehyde dehydrogenase family protein n=1 Tax=Thalassotalea euphylliae TaxID=1655234 RepID=UPI0036254C54